MSLYALFLAAFISATVFPGGSELGLAYLVNESPHSLWLLVGVATLGNTLGGVTTYGLGWLAAYRWPADEQFETKHRKALERVRRYGVWALLLSWVPVIGDPICFAAGWLRTAWLPSLILMTFGKGVRYILIALIASA